MASNTSFTSEYVLLHKGVSEKNATKLAARFSIFICLNPLINVSFHQIQNNAKIYQIFWRIQIIKYMYCQNCKFR